MVTLLSLSQPSIAKTGTRGLDCQHETNEVVTTRALGHTHTHPWESEAVGEGGQGDKGGVARKGWAERGNGASQSNAALPK